MEQQKADEEVKKLAEDQRVSDFLLLCKNGWAYFRDY